MAKLTQAQVAMYAQAAGMPNPQLMAAIAMAESGGNTRAHNPVPPDNSYGLWQINMLGSMGPARRREYGITSNTALFDPAVNARAAAKILSSQGLKAWSTYTNGAYKKYMGGGATPVFDFNDPFNLWPDDWGDAPGSLGGDSLNDMFGGDGSTSLSMDPGLADVAKGIGTIAEATAKAAVWMAQPANWVRVAYVVGGAALAGMGLYIIASPLVGKAAAATPGAKAVKSMVKGK
ncbi:transglycosylase SLT domain-containing protein [Streptomyces albidoflavus]